MHFRDNVCILGICRVQDNDNICILGIFEFMGIFRVFIFTSCVVNNDRESRDTFSMETAQTIMNVRNVEMYESKLVPNCGQFYTLFSL